MERAALAAERWHLQKFDVKPIMHTGERDRIITFLERFVGGRKVFTKLERHQEFRQRNGAHRRLNTMARCKLS